MNFAQWLEGQMQEQNLTRAKLAQIAHVSERSVYYWLSGERVPHGALRHLLEMTLKATYKEEVHNAPSQEMDPPHGKP